MRSSCSTLCTPSSVSVALCAFSSTQKSPVSSISFGDLALARRCTSRGITRSTTA